jgi:translation initiation factor 2B subunit (eIF-2B alpha/beta/delta family)
VVLCRIKLYEELALDGVNCQLINDNEVGYYIHDMTCVMVGAEVILDNGAVLNRAGTSIVALLAHHAHKPFYVFAETYKFLRKNYFTQRDIPQRSTEDPHKHIKTISIDLTLPEFITLFCTESGLYNP